MNKHEFLTELRAKLWALPQEDAQSSVDYYAEMIADRMEDGLSEEEAVAAIGDVEEIAKAILANASLPKPEVQPKKASRRLRWWEILLLVFGFPLWGSLAISMAAVIFSVWISLWSVVITIFATSLALGVSALGCIFACLFIARIPGSIWVALGAALVCAGLAILFFLLGRLAAMGMVRLSKLIWQGMKAIFTGKERSV